MLKKMLLAPFVAIPLMANAESLPQPAEADNAPSKGTSHFQDINLSLNVHLASYHIGGKGEFHRDTVIQDDGITVGYNEYNPGIGLTFSFNNRLSLATGAFKNSYGSTTPYAALKFRTPISDTFDLTVLGAFGNYHGRLPALRKTELSVLGGIFLSAQIPRTKMSIDIGILPEKLFEKSKPITTTLSLSYKIK